jgi:hypothetical protein
LFKPQEQRIGPSLVKGQPRRTNKSNATSSFGAAGGGSFNRREKIWQVETNDLRTLFHACCPKYRSKSISEGLVTMFPIKSVICKGSAAVFLIAMTLTSIVAGPAAASEVAYDYKVLATNKTSTMQKEMTEAANAGYRLEKVMGGNTRGGSEVVVIMSKLRSEDATPHYEYKLLATSKTSTMEKELQQVGEEGFDYKDQTIFNTTFGGEEVVVILEADRQARSRVRYEYKLLATNRTSTMQKELQEAGDEGFRFVGFTVSKTAFGGKEIVSILRKEVTE